MPGEDKKKKASAAAAVAIEQAKSKARQLADSLNPSKVIELKKSEARQKEMQRDLDKMDVDAIMSIDNDAYEKQKAEAKRKKAMPTKKDSWSSRYRD